MATTADIPQPKPSAGVPGTDIDGNITPGDTPTRALIDGEQNTTTHNAEATEEGDDFFSEFTDGRGRQDPPVVIGARKVDGKSSQQTPASQPTTSQSGTESNGTPSASSSSKSKPGLVGAVLKAIKKD